MKATDTGCRIRIKKNTIKVESEKYDNDENYQRKLEYSNHINNTLNSIFIAFGESYKK